MDALIDIRPAEFRLSTVYKRSLWMVAAAIAVIPVLVYGVDTWSDVDPIVPTDAFLLLIGGVVIAGVLVFWSLRWRMRVDSIGISRRQTFRWRTWTWCEFASGTVRAGRYYGSFVFTRRKGLGRYLSLTYLDNEAQQHILKLCEQVWHRPEVQAPEVLDIKPGAPIVRPFTLKRIRASNGGLEIITPQRTFAYRWTDLQRLVFFRRSHSHVTFVDLELHLPHGVEKLRVEPQYDFKQWAGPAADVVAQFFQNRVSADRIVNCALTGPANSLDEVEARLKREAEKLKYFGYWAVTFVLCVLGFIGYIAYQWFSGLRPNTDPVMVRLHILFLAVAALLLLPLISVPFLVRRFLTKQSDYLLAERERLVAEKLAARRPETHAE